MVRVKGIGHDMLCKDCLMYQRRRDDLAQQAIGSVNYCCAQKLADIVGEVARQTRQAFNEHIFLMDTECPNGECILCKLTM